MNTEYQWWLLAVVLAAAAGIAWLLRGSLSRRDVDIDEAERADEAEWIAAQLRDAGEDVSATTIGRALELHRSYLQAPPPPPPPAPDDALGAAEGTLEEPAAFSSAARRDERDDRDELAEPDVRPARYRESRSGG